MQAKKKYGQNFLVDTNIIEQIINSFSVKENDLVVEIGPGRGALTSQLMKNNNYLLAYEIDLDMKKYLDKLENSKVHILYQDILSSDITKDIEIINYNNLFLVGNLPYYITTPIIEYITKSYLNFKSFTIMVQKEVAERFMAHPQSKEYGYFTVFLNYFYTIELVTYVSRNCFNPIPKVDSAVIKLIPKKNIMIDNQQYFEFLKQAFKMKRKKLKNNLDELTFNKVLPVLKQYNFDENVRAEQLSNDIFLEMYDLIK